MAVIANQLGCDISGPTSGKPDSAPTGFVYYDTTLDQAQIKTPSGWTALAPLIVPAADPGVEGQLWNDNGTLTVSAG
ncbi:MAG: hypothetical protein ABFD92_21390 [Planctomycetaceae bacterium]